MHTITLPNKKEKKTQKVRSVGEVKEKKAEGYEKIQRWVSFSPISGIVEMSPVTRIGLI